MKPAPFQYHRPFDLDRALDLLARFGSEAKPLSGGQSLGPMLNMRIARPAHLVDLNDLVELDYVRTLPEVLEIGALTRHHRIASEPEVAAAIPLLAAAARSIGHYAIRQRGTLGGSLVQADPAAQLPLVAVTLDAEVLIRSRSGRRSVPAAEFLQSVMTVDLRGDELVTGVRFPRPAPGAGWAFELFQRRRGDFALVAVAVSLVLDAAGAVDRLAIGLGGVGVTAMRLSGVETAARGRPPSADWVESTAEAAAAAIEPEDEARVPAEFRRELTRILTARALNGAIGRSEAA